MCSSIGLGFVCRVATSSVASKTNVIFHNFSPASNTMTEEQPTFTKLLGITSIDMLRYQRKQKFLSRPRLLGLYDIDHEQFSPTTKIRHHFKEPDLSAYPLDLSEVYDSFIQLKRDTQSNLFRPLLHAISNGAEDDGVSDCNSDGVELTSVYARRGILEKIMEFCYGKFNFDALVSRYNGNIYLVEQTPARYEFEQRQVCTHHKRLSQLVFVDTFAENADDGKLTNDDNIFQIVMHTTTLGKYNLHYAGRTQGIIANESMENITGINALNKSRFVAVKQMWETLRSNNLKLLRYWLHAYLSNIRVIYLAYKDKDAVVREPIECLNFGDIPKTCFWKPGICSTFLNEFLEKVEQLMSNVDSLHTVYKFHFNARDKTIYYKKYVGKTEMSFIPEEYVR